MTVSIYRLDNNAQIPEKTRPHDAAYDIKALGDYSIDPGKRELVKTGLAIAVPEGYAALVLARSGLALKNGIAPANAPGLIDANYRGELCVILENRGQENFKVKNGDRIAQLLIIKESDIALEEVDVLPPSPDDRSQQGFGSSGQ